MSVGITFFLISHIPHYLHTQILVAAALPVPLGAGRKEGYREWRCQLLKGQTPKDHFKAKSIPVGVVCKLYKLLPLEY